jgi:serine/threonine-protein kinase
MITRGRDDTDFAKVLDFGLAKLREGSELNELTSQGAIVGTPYYMSPEQVKGDDVDPRSDVYSLGAVMYRALTGHYAFNGPTPMAVFAKHLTEDPVPPSTRAPELAIPRGLSEIVMRALAKSPDERFQRIEDMQAAIASELSQLGTSGIESLLDSQALQRIVEAPTAVAQGKDPQPLPVATRDEVEAYERRLSRTRWVALAFAAVLPLGMGVGGYHLYEKYRASQGRFSGLEVEPNDTAAQANEVPFGSSVSAFLGKRISDSQSDIDVFSVTVPESAKLTELKVKGLPNIPMCTQIFRKGESQPLSQFCPGKSNVMLDIPRLRLPPGPYLFTVVEDMNPYGESGPRYVFENVSDEYTLEVDEALPDPSREVEPNDVQQAATPVEPGATIEGTLPWVGDVDVYCPDKAEPAAKYRFKVDDEPRDGVLAVSFIKGAAGEGPIVRVHTEPSARLGSPDVAATDRLEPFEGGVFEGDSPWCAVVRATVNPLSKEPGVLVPRGSASKYHVTLEEVPKP